MEMRVPCGAQKDAPEMPGIVRVYINPWGSGLKATLRAGRWSEEIRTFL